MSEQSAEDWSLGEISLIGSFKLQIYHLSSFHHSILRADMVSGNKGKQRH